VGLMSSVDLSSGQDGAASAELRRKAQELVRSSVASADLGGREGRRWVAPLAAAAVVAAAACVPVIWPLLPLAATGGGAAVLTAAFTQVGGVGGGLLSEAVIRAWDRMRSRGRSDQGQAGLRDALAEELEADLTLGTPAAATLRGEVAAVLRGVDAVQVAMAATVEESAAGVRNVLVRGLRELGSEFSEFGWMLAVVNQQLTVIAEDVALAAAASRETADSQQQVLVELALLRQEARTGFQRPRPVAGAVSAGPSADEEQAAALDASGVPVSSDCPYPGLAAFQPKDADRFFGRQQLTAVLVARAGELLARPGLLMVLGPSGSGKSSLLGAGLLPGIAAGALPARGSRAWPRDLMTPGRRPLLELATRIASLAGIPAGALEADLRTDPSRITAAIRQALLTNARRQANVPGPAPAGDLAAAGRQREEPGGDLPAAQQQAAAEPRLILIVDQFEEVFTQCGDEQERHAFITALCAAAGAATPDVANQGPIRGHVAAREAPALVVIGIRADFYASAAAYSELIPHLQGRQVIVGPIDEPGLREAIEKPASTAGLVVDAAVVEVLLADLGIHTRRERLPAEAAADSRASTAPAGSGDYGAGRLALLSYALQQTWRNREGRRLTMAGYRATGGIDEAVAQAADNVYRQLDDSGQDTLKRMLLRLVTLGEGTADTRRQVARAELTGSGNAAQAALTRTVLDDMIDARLVTADADTVEITHETLLTAWPRLRRWLTEDRAGLRIHQDLTEAAHDWQETGRDPSHLFRGTRLAVARDWAAHHDQDLNADERAFLDASRHDQLRTTRLRRMAVIALAALALLASGAAAFGLIERATAQASAAAAIAQRNSALSVAVATEANALYSSDPGLAAQLSLAAYKLVPTPDAYGSLINATGRRLAGQSAGTSAGPNVLAFNSAGSMLAVSTTGTVQLWRINPSNLTDPTLLSTFRGARHPAISARSVWFDPGHSTTLAILNDKSATLDTLGRPIRIVTVGNPPLPIPTILAFSHDGRMLAVGQSDGTVQLWNIANPADPVTIGHPFIAPNAGHANVSAVAFSSDSSVLATVSGPVVRGDLASAGTVRLWNIADPADPRLLPATLTTAPTLLAFSPAGRTLATSAADDSVQLWNVTDASSPKAGGTPLSGHTGTVSGMAFSPDGQTLATASLHNSVRLWNVSDPAHPASVAIVGRESTTEEFSTVAIGPDGLLVATAITPLGQSASIRTWLWDTDPARAAASICADASASPPITPIQWQQYFPGVPYDPPCPAPR
jgi:WD40 repeat protein